MWDSIIEFMITIPGFRGGILGLLVGMLVVILIHRNWKKNGIIP